MVGWVLGGGRLTDGRSFVASDNASVSIHTTPFLGGSVKDSKPSWDPILASAKRQQRIIFASFEAHLRGASDGRKGEGGSSRVFGVPDVDEVVNRPWKRKHVDGFEADFLSSGFKQKQSHCFDFASIRQSELRGLKQINSRNWPLAILSRVKSKQADQSN